MAVTRLSPTHSVPLDGGSDVVAVEFIDMVFQRAGQVVIGAICKYLTSLPRPFTLSSNWQIHYQLGGLSVAPCGGSVENKVVNYLLTKNKDSLFILKQ